MVPLQVSSGGRTRYELPFDFRLEAASVSETSEYREMMSENLETIL